ncbi:NAD(P)-binding protein [Ascobolus immersus RN42]|uniref:NAD(P)-binding protein n=1 Tax=Ascobolus immersus RN42 TaxID=1160509 RepID=A0A3N4I7L6_ASCIM|nr:NAD(P)-binding protein [Ascobolus immersus RN42]
MKAGVITRVDGKPGEVYYPYSVVDIPQPTPGPDELLIKIHGAALNHRDLFIRQHLYPGTTWNVPLLADGVGTVVGVGSQELEGWKGKKVLIPPGKGWASDPSGPEESYAVLGGTKHWPNGTLQEYATFSAAEVEECPVHLSTPEAAALPLCGTTAYRAVFNKGQIKAGQNVLITGIGGGVALAALQFACAAGATVFVTSSSAEKIRSAKELGASAGVNYKSPEWEKDLQKMLPKSRPYLDLVVDGAGGDIVQRSVSLLKKGGIIVSYGMTLGPLVPFTMTAVLKNIELRGTTMGSRKEFHDMVSFVRLKQIRPVISTTTRGFESVDELFEIMRSGKQFGKLVVLLGNDQAKL